jgi:hypothetical protein
MKVSTENDNNFGYEKITIVVDNIHLIDVRIICIASLNWSFVIPTKNKALSAKPFPGNQRFFIKNHILLNVHFIYLTTFVLSYLFCNRL